MAIRTIIVDGKTVRAGTADDVGALCTTPTKPNGLSGRTYRWYSTHRPEHLRAPDVITDAAGHPVRDPDTGSRLYDADAVEKWHRSRPGSAHIARRQTTIERLYPTATRRDLTAAAAAGDIRRDEHDRWELRGEVPSRRLAQSLSELDRLGVFTRDADGTVRLSPAGEQLRQRWGTPASTTT